MNKKEQAIAWIKEEIRSLERAPELNGCPMTPEWAAQLDIMRTCLDAVQLSDFAEVSKQAEREYYAGFSSNTAHIDREAWEPCGRCKSCGNCNEAGKEMGEKINYAHPCHSCLNKDNFKPVAFCRYCGRPLTTESWAMLEKRLRGTNP